jgi:WNK lysine deficient protein kinase
MNEQNSSKVNPERVNPEGIVEMSENHRYIRFQEVIRITFNGLLTSYKAFDTTDGVEIAWHKISIPEINEEEKLRFDQFMSHLNNFPNHKDYFVENLSYWFSVESPNEQHYLNIITTNYETIREFIGKVKTLRWKIVKKWCRQLLQALACLQQHEPPIIHRYLSCSHIYIDSGLGTITVGDIWLSFQSNAFNLANSVNDTTRPNFDDPQVMNFELL